MSGELCIFHPTKAISVNFFDKIEYKMGSYYFIISEIYDLFMTTQHPKYWTFTEGSFNICWSALKNLPNHIESPRIVIEDTSFQIWRDTELGKNGEEYVYRISNLSYLVKKQKTTKISTSFEFRDLNTKKISSRQKYPVISIKDLSGNFINITDFLNY